MSRRACLVVAIILLALVACAKEAPEEVESESPVTVMTATAYRGRITSVIHATGLVTPAPGAELIVVAPEAARVAEIPKGEGDVVRRGDLLVRFEVPSSAAELSKQRAEITRAEARLAAARAAETRMRDLVERGIGARKELEAATREIADAEADLAGAQAAASAAETMAARSVVRATFDGVVSKRSHNPGDLVEASASDPVLRVIDPRRLEFTAQVTLADAPRVRVGAPGRVVSQTGRGASSSALRVVSRPIAIQEGMATAPIRLAFSGTTLYPVGAPLQIEIEAESHGNVVLVPLSALVRAGDEVAVFIAAGDKAQRRPVMVGFEDDDHAEIQSGVNVGDTVIISNQNGLPDEAAIIIDKAKAVAPTAPEKDEP